MLEDVIRNILSTHKSSLIESRVFSEIHEDFWHVSVIDEKGFPISSGFHSEKMQARKIAIAEFIERREFRKIKQGSLELQQSWGIHKISTGCGFAVGFDKQNTILRSIQEAVERWVMSLWIDDNYFIESLSSTTDSMRLDPISIYFMKQFDKVLFFKKTIPIMINQNQILSVDVAQTMGLKDNGIFPGSSARDSGNGLWEHALLESYRHLLGVRNNPLRENRFPDNKVHFFAKNSKLALEQISKAYKKDWPTPKIIFHRVETLFDNQAFIARTIIDGWKSWNEGPLERFLY